MYAMWTYDSFPYMLCGKMARSIDDEGYVSIEGYGGYRFKPIRFFSDKIGKKVCKMLKQAEALEMEDRRQLFAKHEKLVKANLTRIAG
jgi:23S rRNA C2498 (ribose-2'-O)-methylase RlmM